MDYYVISKWNNKSKLYENVMYSKDCQSAEFLVNMLSGKYILTIEHIEPHNAPEVVINDHFSEMLEEEEKARQCNKCCMNCNNCYEEYGYIMCKCDEMPEEADLKTYHCNKWE